MTSTITDSMRNSSLSLGNNYEAKLEMGSSLVYSDKDSRLGGLEVQGLILQLSMWSSHWLFRVLGSSSVEWDCWPHTVLSSLPALTSCDCKRHFKISPGREISQYYLVMRKEILPFVTTWMNLEGIILSEIRERKTAIWCYLYVESKKIKLREISKIVVIRGWEMSKCCQREQTSRCKISKFVDLM